MTKKHSIFVATTAYFFIVGNVAAQDVPKYQIFNGVLAAPESPPVTIMLNQVTGQSWMLTVIDKKLQWISVPFNPQVPTNYLPPAGN